MAARVMGIYTSREGVAIALLSDPNGRKPIYSSWYPSFLQPDGTSLYPAEEIHKRVQALAPDTMCLFDEAFPIVPFPMTLPKMKPGQVYQALKIELESHSVTDVMDPVVGFCPGHDGKAGMKKSGVAGFGLALEDSDLQDLKQKHRPLGVMPDLITLPILPLAFALIHDVGEPHALLYLLDGSLVMMAGIRARKIEALEVFYGGEAALSGRLNEVLSENTEEKIYGFEAVGNPGGGSTPPVHFAEAAAPADGRQDAGLLVRDRHPISRVTLAVLLARLPSFLGSLEYGGVHAIETPHTEGKISRRGLGLALGLLALLLLGIGAAFGMMVAVDGKIYKEQKAAIRSAIKSVLPNAPPVAATALIESKIKKAQRLRTHLAPMLAPSTLALPMKGLPALDKIKGIRIVEISSTPDSLRVTFTSSRSIDVKKLKAGFKKSGVGEVKLIPSRNKLSRKSGGGWLYTVTVERSDHRKEISHAE